MIASRGGDRRGDSCRDCEADENGGHHRSQENGWRIVANKTLHEAMISERSRQWRKVIANYTELLEMLSQENPTDDQERPSWLTLLLYECHYHLGVALQRINQPKKAIEEYTKAIDAVSISRDVYCVRALVLSTSNKTTQAVEDLRKALKLNGNHCCALILQGAMRMKIHKEAKDVRSRSPNRNTSEEHLKAVMLNPESRDFLTVDNFRHQQIHEFYDKFLYSLRVPHTILHLTTAGDDLSQVNKPETVKRQLLKPDRGIQSASSSSHRDIRNRDSRCISASDATSNINSIGKRLHSNECDDHSPCNKSHRCVQLTPTVSTQRRWTYGLAATKGNANSISVLPASLERLKPMANGKSNRSDRNSLDGNVSEAKQKTMTNANGIQIFREMNLSETRRLYYKPWMGDRLPVTERERKQRIFLPFKV